MGVEIIVIEIAKFWLLSRQARSSYVQMPVLFRLDSLADPIEPWSSLPTWL